MFSPTRFNKTYPRETAETVDLQEEQHLRTQSGVKLHETVVGEQPWKQVAYVLPDMEQIIMLEIPEVIEVKTNQNRHYFRTPRLPLAMAAFNSLTGSSHETIYKMNCQDTSRKVGTELPA